MARTLNINCHDTHNSASPHIVRFPCPRFPSPWHWPNPSTLHHSFASAETDNFACFSAWTASSVCQRVCMCVCVSVCLTAMFVCCLNVCVFFSFCALNFLCFVATVAISCYCIFKQPAFLFSFLRVFLLSYFIF